MLEEGGLGPGADVVLPTVPAGLFAPLFQHVGHEQQHRPIEAHEQLRNGQQIVSAFACRNTSPSALTETQIASECASATRPPPRPRSTLYARHAAKRIATARPAAALPPPSTSGYTGADGHDCGRTCQGRGRCEQVAVNRNLDVYFIPLRACVRGWVCCGRTSQRLVG